MSPSLRIQSTPFQLFTMVLCDSTDCSMKALVNPGALPPPSL
jgi:hypothetical protein